MRRQLISEQLPIRKEQLYGTYGPGGTIPLIPDAQPSSVSLSFGAFDPVSNGYLEIANANAFAVDISDWQLSGPVTFTFAKGDKGPRYGCQCRRIIDHVCTHTMKCKPTLYVPRRYRYPIQCERVCRRKCQIIHES